MLLPAIAEHIGALDEKQLVDFVEGLDGEEMVAILSDWSMWQLPYQKLPDGEWRRWLFRAGRGTGKTHTGAKTTNEIAEDRKKIRTGEIGVIGRTHADVRHTMIEGPSGILATAKPDFRPHYEPGNNILTWPNGVRGRIGSVDRPESLRGWNCAWIWGDEPAHWPDLESVWWGVIEFTLRLGWARCMLTTTPTRDPALKKIEDQPDTVVTEANTFQNPFLDKKTREAYKRIYAGTTIGRQELYAEYLPDNQLALWKLSTLEHNRRTEIPPNIQRVVVAIDPAVTAHEHSDETGIVVGGIDIEKHGFVFDDRSGIYTPSQWGRKAVAAYYRWEADVIVCEVNNGGDLVEQNIRGIDRRVNVKQVRASRGKVNRAEPVAALDERGMIHHVGEFRELEDQLITWEPGARKSPDRLDARVWLFHELMLQEHTLGPISAYTM